jgi:Sec-independent protein translocase protein TatA
MVIAAVIMLLMGPDKLPDIAHKLGSTWRAIKSLQERVESEVREVIPDLPSAGDIARIARSPVNLLNQLADRVDAKEAEDAKVAVVHPPEVSEPPPPHLTPRPKPASVDDKTSPTDPSLN